MAIFGTSYSKFKSGSTEVDLRHSILKPTWNEPQLLEHRSIINANRNYILLSNDLQMFQVVCNIWQNANPASVMINLLSYNHDTVKFMPHSTIGTYIMETDGVTEADFFILSMIPFYIKNEPPQLEDKLIITFKSLRPVHPSTVTPIETGFIVDESDDFLVDEDGDKVIVDTIP